jgi:hypothetical protein
VAGSMSTGLKVTRCCWPVFHGGRSGVSAYDIGRATLKEHPSVITLAAAAGLVATAGGVPAGLECGPSVSVCSVVLGAAGAVGRRAFHRGAAIEHSDPRASEACSAHERAAFRDVRTPTNA